jgi:hypothetical protein
VAPGQKFGYKQQLKQKLVSVQTKVEKQNKNRG